MSSRATTIRWAIAIAAAFGVGALVAAFRGSGDETAPRPPQTAGAERAAGRASAERESAVEAPAPTAGQPAAGQPAAALRSAETARAPRTPAPTIQPTPPAPNERGHRMLEPVVWSRDLAAAYETARETRQLVLLFATPGKT